ncbi:uncharacterized protein LOC120293959 [Eucalyptus grandis]|uniref:uncharacterized protein LOC120293959 n=1 Tax=Eucalyptus grandis TaxID=71139 RepID=UPI00192EBCE8|nr:uncharacterized protein LOC120293959 [Eucalyptus grandis]
MDSLDLLKKGEFRVAKNQPRQFVGSKEDPPTRTECRSSFYWRIGNGCSVSLWFDNWHPRGPLNLYFSDSTIYASGLPRQATVADLFTNCRAMIKGVLDSWADPLPTLSHSSDRFGWKGNTSHLFTVASAWDLIRRRKTRVSWHTFIWNNSITSRYQFNLWLIAKRRLSTQALLLYYGRIDSALCPFCNEVPDSIDHLFFGCRISASIAFFWASRCNLPWRNNSWVENLNWAATFLMGKDFYKCIARFSFGALCYYIWKHRNSILFREQSLSVPEVKNQLIKVVRDKATTYRNVDDTYRNRRLQRSWGIDPIIFSARDYSTSTGL